MKDLCCGSYAVRRCGHIHGKRSDRDVASVVDGLFASLENQNTFPTPVKAGGYSLSGLECINCVNCGILHRLPKYLR